MLGNVVSVHGTNPSFCHQFFKKITDSLDKDFKIGNFTNAFFHFSHKNGVFVMMNQNANESAYWLQFYIGLHPDKPIEELQELALKAQQAAMKNWKKMQDFDPEEDNTFSTSAIPVSQNQPLALDTETSKNRDFYIFFKRDMLLTQNQDEINAALNEDEEKLKCCICGKKFPNLKNHLRKVHQVSAEDYNKACNYPVGTDLRSKKLIASTKARVDLAKATREEHKEINAERRAQRKAEREAAKKNQEDSVII
ncbi:MAG: MucR family transcriptional regulator [Desulfovibrio sp.]|nr:MucR family transcriptional regulator [Desulfovibrio sp.]